MIHFQAPVQRSDSSHHEILSDVDASDCPESEKNSQSLRRITHTRHSEPQLTIIFKNGVIRMDLQLLGSINTPLCCRLTLSIPPTPTKVNNFQQPTTSSSTNIIYTSFTVVHQNGLYRTLLARCLKLLDMTILEAWPPKSTRRHMICSKREMDRRHFKSLESSGSVMRRNTRLVLSKGRMYGIPLK